MHEKCFAQCLAHENHLLRHWEWINIGPKISMVIQLYKFGGSLRKKNTNVYIRLKVRKEVTTNDWRVRAI